MVESGNITNVANPPPPAAGQVVQPTAAVISNPLIGPFAVLNFKNSGTTPAYRLTHWADIVVRAFPLNAALPERPPNIRPAASVLGPGASTQKTIFIPAALTAQQLAKLLALSIAMIYKLEKHKGLPSFRIGTALRFDPLAILNWLQKEAA